MLKSYQNYQLKVLKKFQNYNFINLYNILQYSISETQNCFSISIAFLALKNKNNNIHTEVWQQIWAKNSLKSLRPPRALSEVGDFYVA